MPETGVEPFVRVNVADVKVDAFIVSLNVAVIGGATELEPFFGLVVMTVGIPENAVIRYALSSETRAAKFWVDASLNKLLYVTLALAIAVAKAVNMSSLTSPEMGEKGVVIGLLMLSAVSPLKAMLKFLSAASTLVCVITESCAGLKPANHPLGVVNVPIRFATNRSVKGVTFTVPDAIAIEW